MDEVIEEELAGPVVVAAEDGTPGAPRLFTKLVLLAYLDSPVYDFGPTEIDFKSDPLPVYSEDMKPLGFAAVSMDTRCDTPRLVAIVVIDAASEERLLAETKQVKLYPRLFGAMAMAGMPLFDFHAQLRPMKLRLDGIMLSRYAPTDKRVPPFGEIFI